MDYESLYSTATQALNTQLEINVQLKAEGKDAIKYIVTLRTEIKDLKAELNELHGDKDHPENYCHLCGGKNIIWYADNELWNEVVDKPELICCPLCFVKLAENKGIVPTAWRLSREGDVIEVKS